LSRSALPDETNVDHLIYGSPAHDIVSAMRMNEMRMRYKRRDLQKTYLAAYCSRRWRVPEGDGSANAP